MPRDLLKLLLLLGLVLLLPGCVHVDIDLALNADGSGQIAIGYERLRSAEDDFAQLASVLRKQARELDIDPHTEVAPGALTREALGPACDRHDIQLLDCRHSGTGQWERVDLTLAFKQVDMIATVLYEATGRFSGLIDISRMDAGDYQMVVDRPYSPAQVFCQTHPDAEPFPARADAHLDSLTATSEDEAMAYVLKRSAYLGGLFSAKVKVTLPAVPIEHNAARIEGTSCTWVFGPQDVNGYMVNPRPYVRFLGSGLIIPAREYGK